MELLAFDVAGTACALELGRVREIRVDDPLTPVPLAAPALRGVVNVRGQVVPVVDLSIRLGAAAQASPAAALVLVDVHHGETASACAVLVDAILGIEETDRILPPPQPPLSAADAVRGIAPLERGLTLVLDPDALLDPAAVQAARGPQASAHDTKGRPRTAAGASLDGAGEPAKTSPTSSSTPSASASRASPRLSPRAAEGPVRNQTLPAAGSAIPERPRRPATIPTPVRPLRSPGSSAPSQPPPLSPTASRTIRSSPPTAARAVPGAATAPHSTPAVADAAAAEGVATTSSRIRSPVRVAAAALSTIGVLVAIALARLGPAAPDRTPAPLTPALSPRHAGGEGDEKGAIPTPTPTSTTGEGDGKGATPTATPTSTVITTSTPSSAQPPATIAIDPEPARPRASSLSPAPAGERAGVRGPGAGHHLPAPDPASTVIVRRGDTLWALSGRLRGDPRRWPVLYRANRDDVRDPDLLHPGQRLRVPPQAR